MICPPEVGQKSTNKRGAFFMSKYDVEYKLKVIRHYHLGMEGFHSTGRHFGVNASCVRKWVSIYDRYGVQGLTHRNGSYPAQFKESVIEYKRRYHLSSREAAIYFGIPSPSTLTVWERRYDKGGIQALTEHRGRKNMSKSLKSWPVKPLEEMSQQEMQAELEYLRAENAYLKKLRDLIRLKRESASKPKPDSCAN